VGTVGEVNWPQYYDYANSQTDYGGMPLYKNMASHGWYIGREDVKQNMESSKLVRRN